MSSLCCLGLDCEAPVPESDDFHRPSKHRSLGSTVVIPLIRFYYFRIALGGPSDSIKTLQAVKLRDLTTQTLGPKFEAQTGPYTCCWNTIQIILVQLLGRNSPLVNRAWSGLQVSANRQRARFIQGSALHKRHPIHKLVN